MIGLLSRISAPATTGCPIQQAVTLRLARTAGIRRWRNEPHAEGVRYKRLEAAVGERGVVDRAPKREC